MTLLFADVGKSNEDCLRMPVSTSQQTSARSSRPGFELGEHREASGKLGESCEGMLLLLPGDLPKAAMCTFSDCRLEPR